MNKKLLLAGGMVTLVLAGCQGLEDQMGAKLAESIINTASNGEVKVSIEDLESGKMNIITKEGTISVDGNENGGKFTMTDQTGKTIMEGSGDGNNLVIKDETGKAVMTANEDSMTITDNEGRTGTFTTSSGEARPDGAPNDMPSPDGAMDYNYFNYDQMTSLTYALDGEDMKGNCAKVQRLVEGAGWSVSTDGFSFETSNSSSKSYSKGEAILTVMCGLNDGQTTIGLQKNVVLE